MSPTLKSLGIDRLSVDERVQLLEDLWEDIAAEVESTEIPQSHKDELDRRIAAHEANPEAGSTWDEVKVRLRQMLGEST